MPNHSHPNAAFWIALAVTLLAAPAVRAGDDRVGEQLRFALRDVETRHVPSGILYDRVLPMSGISDHDGTRFSVATPAGWRQMVFELRRASLAPVQWPDTQRLSRRGGEPAGEVGIGILNVRYNRLRDDAVIDGAAEVVGDRVVIRRDDAVVGRYAFAAAPARAYTFRGAQVTFRLDPNRYITNTDEPITEVEIDPGDGAGFRETRPGGTIDARYARTGIHRVRVRATTSVGVTLRSAFDFDVRALQTPVPDDTMMVTAAIPYQSLYASGEAFVYLAPGHANVTNPLVLVEGFDLDDTMNWDEIYAMLNKENLIETVRADGYDAVVLNFGEATAAIQANALLLVQLLQEIEATIVPQAHYVLIGASMGGLVSRYAVAYMESNAIAHRVRTLITFDSPHKGANIPLGMQYWLDFFSDESAEAAFLLSRLDTPAARQMLVYHHTNPPGATGQHDPLRNVLLTDFALVGGYPSQPRLVAFANGSGSQVSQGFASGAQIIRWEYTSLLVDVTGNVWAVPDGGPRQILDAEINLIWPLPDESMSVTVNNTVPYDNAPGGWRSSMADADAVAAPYGDIVALHPNHSFIPMISALDLTTFDLFYNASADANLLASTPFDVVYFPAANDEHVDINSINAPQLLDEIRSTPSSVRPSSSAIALFQNIPNPFNPVTTIRFVLDAPQHVTLRVYDVRGNLVTTLENTKRGPGEHDVVWNGHDARGVSVSAGVYFYRLETREGTRVRKMTLVK